MNRVPPVALVVALVFTVLVGSAFSFADFGATQSATSVQSGVSTSSIGDETVDLSGGLYVFVAGDDPADREFATALVDELRARGVDAEEVTELREQFDRPVILVGHEVWRLDYTPVRADATVDWQFLYVQSGTLTQFGSSTPWDDDFTPTRLLERLAADDFRPIILSNETTVVVDGHFTLTDETTGVLSLPHYDRHVRDAVAVATVDALLPDSR
ncbi:hypothetical protein [Halorarius litoreus]|uniref:hypothetical protein n=1 Tax=Halorarius litoreus TaxID=2962676 RepID=UPI0020CCBA4C|nr:hypothetical protein [Halorarius litoreus]